VQTTENYWKQQEEYLNLIKKSKLEYLIVDSTELLNKKFVKNLVDKILKFIHPVK